MKKVQPSSDVGGSHSRTRGGGTTLRRRQRRRRNLFFFLIVFVGGGALSFLWLSMIVHNNNNNNNIGDHHRVTTTAAVVRLNDFIATSKTAATTNSSSTAAASISGATATIPSTVATANGGESSMSKLEKSKQTTKKKKVKLQDKLDEFYLQHGYSYNTNGTDPDGDDSLVQSLWHFSDYVPLWMKQYFDWHKQQLLELEATFGRDEATTNGSNNKIKINHRDVVSTLQNSGHKLLVMQCLKTSDSKCGGTADRLKPFLYVLKQAALMNRILFLHWTSPCNIDEFLVPPIGGFDWRAPRWLQDWLASPIVTTDVEKRHLILDQKTIKQFQAMVISEEEEDQQGLGNSKQNQAKVGTTLLTPSTPIVRTRLQSVTGFREHYDVEPLPIFNPTTGRFGSIGNIDGNNNNKDNRGEEKSLIFDDETAEQQQEEPTFKEVYHDVWRIAFRPSRAVAELIEQEIYSSSSSTKSSSSNNRENDIVRNHNNDNTRSTSGYLIPNQFVGVHLRAMYGSRAFRTTAELMDMVSNGLNCASMHQYHNNNNSSINNKKMTSDKYFFASDLGHALELAQDYGTSKKVSVHVVHGGVMENQGVVPEKSLARVKEDGYQHVDGPLHFAKADNLHSRQPSEFYSTFVDLFILGMGRCTVMNRGGFGTFGSLISYNSTCLVNQKTSTKGIQHRCNWTDGGIGAGKDDRHDQKDQDEDDVNDHDFHQLQQQSNYVDETTNNGRWWPPPIFLDPMP